MASIVIIGVLTRGGQDVEHPQLFVTFVIVMKKSEVVAYDS